VRPTRRTTRRCGLFFKPANDWKKQMSVDIVEMVQNAVAKALDPERLNALVNEQICETVDKTLKEVLSQELRSYSDFGKRLESVVKESLKMDPIEIPAYNHALTEYVRRFVAETSQSLIQTQVGERLKALMDLAPGHIKVSELVEAYRKRREDEIDSGCTCEGDYDSIFVRLGREYPDSDTLKNYWKLEFWPSESDKNETERYSSRKEKTADVRLCIRLNDRKGESQTGVVHSVTYRDGETTKNMFIGPLYDFEKLCFNLQASQSVIELDVDEESINDLDLDVAVRD
jgi:hypothetical protein